MSLTLNHKGAAHPDLPGGKATGAPLYAPRLSTTLLKKLRRRKARVCARLAFPPGRSGWAVLLLLLSSFLHAQDVRFTFDKQKILLGEPLQMKIETLMGAGENRGHLDTIFSPDSLPHFEVLDRGKIDTSRVAEGVYLKQTITLTSWDSGSWSLPTVNRAGLSLQPTAIEVGYTSPWDAKQPYHDIKGIIPVKHPGQSTWWWYVIGAAVLIGLFLLFFPRGKKGEAVSPIDSNAYKKAMQQLDELQKRNLTDSKLYYTELINIFRAYLKGAKGIQSFSKTTDDLSIQLQSQKLPQERYNNLLQTLRLSDLVKFAQYGPEAPANNEAFNTIKQSITTLEGHAV